MRGQNTKEFILDGLDCAHCAGQIEDKVNNLPQVKSSTVNFMMKTLIIEFKDKNKDKNIDKNIDKTIEDIVVNIDSSVTLKKKQKESETVKKYVWYRDQENLMLILGAILFAVAMFFGDLLEPSITFVFFLASYLIIGGDVVLTAFRNVLKGQLFDENFLMTIATIGAFSIGQYPEGVAVMLFYKVGILFQDIAVNKSRKSISDLMDIRPDFANLKNKNNITKVSPESVNIGDIIVIRPGEKIPLDGVVVSGTSMVDTSAITGESMPRHLDVEGDALSGFINQGGLLEVQVTKEFGQSTVSKILELVQNASNNKAKTENFITKFAKVYTPAVVVIAALIAIVPPIFVSGALFNDWLYRALVFLVVSCPCALVISIPLGFFGGIGAASKNGILIKGSNYLEALNHIDTIVFDKTGTLTKGEFSVTSIEPAKGFTKDDILEYAAYTESYSTHPIAKSITLEYGEKIDNTNVKDYKEISGKGIEATIYGEKVLAGNKKLMDSNKISYSSNENKLVGTIIYVAVASKYAGRIVIADTIKEDAKDAIKELKQNGIKETVMLTGDHTNVAKDVSKKLGVDKFYAELLPQGKVERLEELYSGQGKDKSIAVVGDGINDAPILARADIGIAMGGMGSDAAIEAADVVIMTDEPSKLSSAIRIAKKTQRVVLQNIVFALAVKLIILLLGAFGMATMWEAVFADVGVSVIAILNAMRVMKAK